MSTVNSRLSNQEIIDAYKETGSVWRAAEALGCAGQTVHKRLARLGYPTATAKWSEEEYAELRRLLLEGLTLTQISDRLGRSYAAVATKASRLELPRNLKPRDRKLPRGAGYDKVTTLLWMDELERYEGKYTHFCKTRGHSTETQTRAFERHCPERWRQYVEKHSNLGARRCEYCEREFVPNSGKQRFCSRRCQSEKRGDDSYFGGKKRSTIGWAERQCQLCLKTFERRLASHHVLGKENDPENKWLVALCNGCHDIVTRVAARNFVNNPEQLEALVSLVWLRHNGADWSTKAPSWSLNVSVEIDAFDEEEWGDS